MFLGSPLILDKSPDRQYNLPWVLCLCTLRLNIITVIALVTVKVVTKVMLLVLVVFHFDSECSILNPIPVHVYIICGSMACPCVHVEFPFYGVCYLACVILIRQVSHHDFAAAYVRS